MSLKNLLRCAPALLVLLAPGQPGSALSEGQARETVILLHGFGRSVGSMRPMERALVAQGYATRNVGYPWRSTPIGELANHLAGEVGRCCTSEASVHFVTHSMGGILVRAFLDEHRPENLGRVVMLAPPNAGTEWVDTLASTPLLKLAGPAASSLGTDAESAPLRLGPVDFELGVLAGNKSWNVVGSWLIPGEDDGTVAVDKARIDGMTDFRIVDANHTTIVRTPEIIAETIHFLENGSFRPAD